MNAPYLVSLEASGDRAVCGGKAAGLASLLGHGFSVPPGVCVTTRAYLETLLAARLSPAEKWTQVKDASERDRERILEEQRVCIASLTISPNILEPLEGALKNIGKVFASDREVLWAVRSSATNEDEAERTFAGLYRTILGVPHLAVPTAITACWTSLWTTAAWAYHERGNPHDDAPAMAVIIQPLLSARVAGVAYSRHPVTGKSACVVINAILGLAEPMVSGMVPPDCYVIQTENTQARLLERHIVTKTTARRPTVGAVHDAAVPAADQQQPSLTDEETLALARLIQQVERAMNHPVDVEWALDERGMWLLQSRPIPEPAAKKAPFTLTEAPCAWSRANFRETLPDLPSPLGLFFLRQFMEMNIVQQYLRLGCSMAPGISSIRILHGRPYINVTLFQSFMAQLGGDSALVAEHMGGKAPAPPAVDRLPWWKILKAGIMMEWKIRQAARRAPRWFAEMKSMAEIRTGDPKNSSSAIELLSRLDRLGERLSSRDLTFAIVAGVSQSFYVLQRMLERRVGDNWRPLLNAALQGLGNVISARQILWLAELAEIVRKDPVAFKFFHTEPWETAQFRTKLAGTRFLQAFDDYLTEYGHRAVAESDVMSPRFADVPEYVLDVIRRHVMAPRLSIQDIHQGQSTTRNHALQRMRTAFARRCHEWIYVRWWHTRLSQFLALREANRHHLMYFTTTVRRLVLTMGQQFVVSGVLVREDDLFFLTGDEIRKLVSGGRENWKALVAVRRADRERNAARAVPDFIMGPEHTVPPIDEPKRLSSHALQALSISSGVISGPVRLVRSQADFRNVQRGDIIVTAVIDPGMAPLFGLAGGLIAEMGGILSHGAIIAREYGIPTVANVHGITRLLQDGQYVTLDADSGIVAVL